MEYKENSDDPVVPDNNFLDDNINELDFDEESTSTTEPSDTLTEDSLSIIEPSEKKPKAQTAKDSLKARRAIEDHLEQRRLRKELDYLFDDDFANENPNNPTKP